LLFQIFVVDSASSEVLMEARTSLKSCLADDAVQGLPLLLLCNKQDMADARTPEEVVKISIQVPIHSCGQRGILRFEH
jgi:signal recognition particle receptor subunit beta